MSKAYRYSETNSRRSAPPRTTRGVSARRRRIALEEYSQFEIGVGIRSLAGNCAIELQDRFDPALQDAMIEARLFRSRGCRVRPSTRTWEPFRRIAANLPSLPQATQRGHSVHDSQRRRSSKTAWLRLRTPRSFVRRCPFGFGV